MTCPTAVWQRDWLGLRPLFSNRVNGRRVDNVLRAAHIGVDAFRRIVLGRGYLFERRGMDDVVHLVKGAAQTLLIAHVA